MVTDLVASAVDILGVAAAEDFQDLQEDLEMMERVVVGLADDAFDVQAGGCQVRYHNHQLLQDVVQVDLWRLLQAAYCFVQWCLALAVETSVFLITVIRRGRRRQASSLFLVRVLCQEQGPLLLQCFLKEVQVRIDVHVPTLASAVAWVGRL